MAISSIARSYRTYKYSYVTRRPLPVFMIGKGVRSGPEVSATVGKLYTKLSYTKVPGLFQGIKRTKDVVRDRCTGLVGFWLVH